MQLPQRVFVGALVVPMLLASVGTAFRSDPEISVGHLVFAVRSSEIVLAGTAGTDAERQDVVDAVRVLTASHRITDMITPNAGERMPVPPAVVSGLLGVVLDQGVTEFTGVVRKGHLTASARVADPDRAGELSDALRAAAPDLRVDEDFTSA
ncbi:hypothetical protein ABZ345_43140 [Lentzea sp. NPDC005914]|uniref:hypothetical protein n=1 Tax=Lentzea sp. NPDC005914 TaxID=3154572 RepID=UPI0033DA3BE0